MKRASEILSYIDNPWGRSLREIADYLGLTPAGAAYNMKQLRLSGIAINTARGRGSRWILVSHNTRNG